MPVASTPTFVDSQMEHKKLRESIALLKQEKEKAECDLKQTIIARDAIHKAHKSSVVLSDIKDIALENMREHVRKEIEQSKQELSNLQRDIGIYKKQLQEISASLNDRRIQNEIMEKQYDFLQKSISKDTKILNEFRAEKETAEKILNERIAALLKQKNELTERNVSYETDYQNKRIEIMQSEQCIATRQEDLNIYEARLRTKVAELYPSMEIIL